MILNTLFSLAALASLGSQRSERNFLNLFFSQIRVNSKWRVFLAASFLVSVPVFIQAPLVRLFPWLSLLLTGLWVFLGFLLYKSPKTHLWGDLLLGFSWSWLAGSIYWGWFRHEPLIHMPLESIGLPFVLWCLWRGWGKIGNLFYLGSLFGTGITDLYFYIDRLIPSWRELMKVEPEFAKPILQSTIVLVQSPWGIGWAIVLANLLFAVGLLSLQKPSLHWWAFGGAVLSTILVDSLFWIAACLV